MPTELNPLHHRLAIVLTGLGFAITVICALLAGNAYYHLDDVTHYLFARWSWRWPGYLLDDWGRPGFTVAYWLPSALGWTACRVFSAMLTAAAAWFAYLTARKIDIRHSWLVVPMCFAQPLVFQLSQTTLTETPLTFYLILATWFAISRRWALSSFVLSAAFVTRHEAIIFLPIWIWFAWRDNARWRSIALMLWAPILANGLAASFGMNHVLSRFLNPTPTAQYGHGGWLTYFVRALHAYGPAVSTLAIIGFRGSWRNQSTKLVAVSVLGFFLAQTIVFRFGLFASGGYSRFLVGISPLIAILSVNGINQLLSHETRVWRRAGLAAAAAMALLWLSLERQLQLHDTFVFTLPQTYRAVVGIRIFAAIFGLIAIIATILSRQSGIQHQRIGRLLMPGLIATLLALTAYVFHRPLPIPADAKLINKAMLELEAGGLADVPIMTAHPYVEWIAGGELPQNRPSTRERIEQAPIGAIVLWESRLTGGEDHKLRVEEFIESPAFREILRSEPLPYQDDPYLYAFEKIGEWRP